MATEWAPISGGIALVGGLLAGVTVIFTVVPGGPWTTVVSALTAFTMLIIVWRGMKKHDREHQERMERLEQRLGPD